MKKLGKNANCQRETIESYMLICSCYCYCDGELSNTKDEQLMERKNVYYNW